MTPRLVISVSVGLVFGPVLPPFAAGEHPSLPQQPQLQQLPRGTTTSQPSSAQTMEVSKADISAGFKKYIDSSAKKSADKKFHVKYRGKDLSLNLIKVHDDRLSSLGAGKYFACVDMKGTDGRIYDIDFFMTVSARNLKITETSVHKLNGKPLYNWKEEHGVWRKVRVS